MVKVKKIFAEHRESYSGISLPTTKVVIGYERICDCGKSLDRQDAMLCLSCLRSSSVPRVAENPSIHRGEMIIPIEKAEAEGIFGKQGGRCRYCSVIYKSGEKRCTGCGANL